jgi:hypothetical protein
MRTISVRLDDESNAALQLLCERLQATQTDVIRQALSELAAQAAPTPASLAADLGLVGMFDSGDGTLAAQHSSAVKAKLATRRAVESRAAVRDADHQGAPTTPTRRRSRN